MSCGCLTDVFILDKEIRTVAAPDKIVRYDIQNKELKYPICLNGHSLNYDDISVLYGKKAQKLDIFRTVLKTEMLLNLLELMNKNKTLTEIVMDMCDFRQCDPLATEGFVHNLQYVKILSMRCAKLNPIAFEGIIKGLKGNQNILSIDLYSTNLTSGIITNLSQSLSTSFSLQSLNLSSNILEFDAVKSLCNTLLKKTQSLKNLYLEATSLDAESLKILCDCLAHTKGFTKLSLADNLFQAEHGQALIALLKGNSDLEWLNLTGIFPSIEGYKSIGKAIDENKKLNSLILESTKLETEELSQISDSISKHKALKKLSLADNALDDTSAIDINKIIEKSISIEELSVRCNSLGVEAMKLITSGMKSNVNFKRLNVRKNLVLAEGSKIIADFLRGSPCFLEELDMSFNQIGEEGGKEIADSLKNNKGIKKIDLGDNELADEFALVMGETIKSNATLEQVILESNCITNIGIHKISEGIKETSSITIINLENNAYTQLGTQALLKARLNNPRVRVITSEVSHFVTSIG